MLHIQINLDSKFQLQQTILIFGTSFQKTVYFQLKTQKDEHHYWIRHIRISSGTNFQLKLTIAIFWTKFAKQGSYFQSKTDKIDTTIKFYIFELVFVSNFTLYKQFWMFGPDFPKKDIYGQNRKLNIIIEFRLFKLVLVPNFSLKLVSAIFIKFVFFHQMIAL